ncbi:toll/interleukin-1 receptor domain-containing protein [Pseudomonas alabamensis]|uniref:TIR domain-containing protein n=1 Tax=Pseudomonas alabamensis TaxID=3064349 RepID=UPI001C92DD95
MIKAFLSHAWSNKEFVRAVANELGRQFCKFDEYSFDSAATFKRSIEEHLDESSVFVFFASEVALERPWVDFELEEAWYKKLEGKLSRAIVFVLDSNIDPAQLPKWLSRAKITRVVSPKLVAREIRYHIDSLIRAAQHPYFEGRSSDIEKFEALLTPIGSPPPRSVAIYGLPNIGKKTFIEKVSKLALTFNRVLPIVVSQGDDLKDLAVKVADQLEPYSTKAGFEHIVKSIRAQDGDELVRRIVSAFEISISNKELPLLVDAGGLFNSDGFMHGFVDAVVAASSSNGNYLFMISNRKPANQIPSLSLRPLTKEHTKRLIARISGDSGLTLSSEAVSELADYVNGYPPSAYYAVELVKGYGVDVVLADKERLVNFKAAVFIKFLTEQVLTGSQINVLAVLATYSPIPLLVIAEALGAEPSVVAGEVSLLIDKSLVVPTESGMYAISDPLTDSVSTALRPQIKIDHSVVRDSLKSVMDAEDAELPRLDLCRLYFRACVRSGSSNTDGFHMVNDLISLTEDYYHRRDFKMSIRCATLALQERPNSEVARDMLIRALIQDEAWDAAIAEIAKHRAYAPVRDIFFLEGFLFRKQGKLDYAIAAFENAMKSGRRGVTINRELATCYYLSDDFVKAKHHVEEALSKSDNQFIIDLSVQIATREGDEESARKGLEKLKAVDKEGFFKHRLSTVELKFGLVADALKAAKEAVASLDGERPPFNVLSQLATCLIRDSKIMEAEQVIQRMAKLYAHTKIDIRLGLECRLEIERSRYARALAILENIKDPHRVVYMSMRRDALAGELKYSVLDDQKRISYEEQLKALERELAAKDVNSFWFALIR